MQEPKPKLRADTNGNVTLLTGDSPRAKLPWKELVPEAKARGKAAVALAECSLSARLQHGDFDLGEGECRHLPVGKYFLPMLKHVKTEAEGKAWVAALHKHGGPANVDKGCATLKDYDRLPPPV